MIVSHRNRFIFFKPLKTAGTSIEAFLSRSCGEKDITTGPSISDNKLIEPAFIERNNKDDNGVHRFHSHTYPDLFYKLSKSKWGDYTKITCVRNPWDLCVSYYWWSMLSTDHSSMTSNRNHFIEKGMFIFKEDNYAEVIRKFKKFLFSPSEIGKNNCDGPETFPMVIDFLARESERFIRDDIDFYIRFENIKDDLQAVCSNIGIQPGDIPRFKTSHRRLDIHYSEYYDNIAKSVVEKKFQACIEKFNYYF